MIRGECVCVCVCGGCVCVCVCVWRGGGIRFKIMLKIQTSST